MPIGKKMKSRRPRRVRRLRIKSFKQATIKCAAEGCNGIVGKLQVVLLPDGCYNYLAYPCETCHVLHWGVSGGRQIGGVVKNLAGNPIFSEGDKKGHDVSFAKDEKGRRRHFKHNYLLPIRKK